MTTLIAQEVRQGPFSATIAVPAGSVSAFAQAIMAPEDVAGLPLFTVGIAMTWLADYGVTVSSGGAIQWTPTPAPSLMRPSDTPSAPGVSMTVPAEATHLRCDLMVSLPANVGLGVTFV